MRQERLVQIGQFRHAIRIACESPSKIKSSKEGVQDEQQGTEGIHRKNKLMFWFLLLTGFCLSNQLPVHRAEFCDFFI